MNIKRLTIILGLTLGLLSCSQTKYFVKSESDLRQLNLDQNTVNYIPLSDKFINTSTILDSTYSLLCRKKYAKLNRYLRSIQSGTPDYYLSKTLYYISKKKYQDAANNLKKINTEIYPVLYQLLLIDLNYEVAKLNNASNFQKFLHDYQLLIDKYPDNQSLKKIVVLRTRYIRYND